MDTRKLEILLEAIQLGSFSKTAEKLGYSQSALVHMMNSLEQEVGLPLLTRSYSGVSLSPEGQQLEPILRSLVALDNQLKSSVKDIANKTSNKIRIVSVPSIATQWLPDAINRMREKHPEFEIELTVVGLEVSDVVARGDADLGFTEAHHIGSNEFLPIKDDPFYAAVPAGSPLTERSEIPLEALTEYTVLVPSGSEKNTAIIALKKLSPKQIRVSAHGGSVLLAMVEHGLGVTILSSLYQSICPATVQMLPIVPSFSRTLGIVTKSFKTLTPAQEKFVAYFKESPL